MRDVNSNIQVNTGYRKLSEAFCNTPSNYSYFSKNSDVFVPGESIIPEYKDFVYMFRTNDTFGGTNGKNCFKPEII